jgi:uncharacterized repeat protein (TIGR02543 family)
MPTSDTSQTTRTKILAGKTLTEFHRLNQFSPQGGRYTFSQSDLLTKNVGEYLGGCCSTTPGPVPSGTYTVTYLGNTNTGGTVPTDGSSPYSSGSTVTILGNSGTLVKTGYQFAGWNTAADGSGTNYVGDNTFPINANTTLYAQWIPQLTGVTLLYAAGTGGSGTAPSSSGITYPTYSTQPVVGNTGSFTRTGYTFGGWNTAANGSGTSYPVSSNITMVASYFPITLHAQWIPDVPSNVNLTYNAGTGGTGTDIVTPYNLNTAAPISVKPVSFTNSDPTKIFYGWNTAANGTGISYPIGSTITMNASKTLYAQWGNSPLVTVTYDANGATGGSVPAPPTDYPTGIKVSVLGQGSLTRPGYTFLAWNSSPTGAGSLYAPGYTFTSKTATLYAQWAPGSTIKSCAPTDTQTTGPSTWYDIPYAQVIADSNTITIYLAAYFGTVLSNVGTGAGPYGIISFVSKTVITSTTITNNTNTTYLNSANDYNYSQTITNGTGVTYWPSGATISSITFPTTYDGINIASEPATFNRVAGQVSNGCGIGAYNSFFSGNSDTQFYFFNQGVQLNYSNGTNTKIINSPVSALYTVNRFAGPIVWSAMPSSNYPYVGITPTTDNTLTSITIIPSTGSTYVNPPMPNFTVQYHPNGATGPAFNPTGLPAPRYMSPYTGTTSITISGNTGSLVKSGFTFSGWNTAADGSGTNYAAGATYGGGASLLLYAKWV